MTAPRSCARPPTWCASASITFPRCRPRSRARFIPKSRAEVLTSADIIDWYAEEGRRAYGRIVPGRQKGVRQIVLQEPVGVVAAFTPWNFPTLTPVRKIAGALAAGCSIIIKASEETPGGCVELVKCFADAGLPAGVLNLVFGVPAQCVRASDPGQAVSKISFTGSIPVGKHLAGLAAKGMKKRHHGARRPLAGRRVRRCRSGKGRRHHRGVQVSQRRSGLHLADALLRAGGSPTASSSPASPNTPRASSSATAWRRAPRLGPLANPRRLDAMEVVRQRRQGARRQDRRPAARVTATRASSSSRR